MGDRIRNEYTRGTAQVEQFGNKVREENRKTTKIHVKENLQRVQSPVGSTTFLSYTLCQTENSVKPKTDITYNQIVIY